MEVEDWISLLSALIIAIGWFVTARHNRAKDVAQKRLEYRLNALEAFLPVWSAIRKDGNAFSQPETQAQFMNSIDKFQIYGLDDENELMNQLVLAIENKNLDDANKSLGKLISLVRSRIRGELDINGAAKNYAMQTLNRNYLIGLLAIFCVVFAWSAIHPHDYFTWFLEVAPALIALPILFFTYKKFPLTPLLYGLILFHAIILMVGGHYTYAEVPLFDWLRDMFDLGRNYYDRVGHFVQGFVPAMVAREILVRKQIVRSKGWLFFIVSCICLSISAVYEFIEWWVAVASGTAADAFLGAQGDVWDTQWDMFLALVGAICAQLILSKIHDRQLERLA